MSDYSVMNEDMFVRKSMEKSAPLEEQFVLWHWQNLNIGRLEFKDGVYTFYVNVKNKEALSKTAFPVDLFFGDKDVIVSDEFPFFMKQFIPSRGRTDVNDLLGIEREDCEFVKLLKVTRKSFDLNNEWLEASHPRIYPKIGNNYNSASLSLL